MFSNTLFIIEAAIGFGLLIFVHELGHFLAARFSGVRVDIFSLGFGPTLLKKRWGETEYRISLIPIGGYVKMGGEEPQPDKPPQPGDFYSKPVGHRALVFGGGVAMSLLSGFVIFILAYRVGVPVVPAEVGYVGPGSPAWKIGLQRGDRILEIDDISPPIDFEDLRTTITLTRPGKGIRLLVDRNGETFERLLHPEYKPAAGLQMAGIYPPTTMRIAETPSLRPGRTDEAPDFQAIVEAGLKPGDEITAVAVEGRDLPIPVTAPQEFQVAVDESAGLPIRIHFTRDGREMAPVAIRPQLVGPSRWLGVTFGSNRIAAVRPGSWAHKAGFAEGDVISAVDGRPCRSWSQVIEMLQAGREQALEVEVRRGERVVELNVPPRLENESVEEGLAFEPGFVVDFCWPGYPAKKAGMESGDEIISADGNAVTDTAELAKVLDKAEGRQIELVWRRGESRMRATVLPQKRWMVQIPFETRQDVVRAGLFGSCLLGARKAYQWTVRVYGTLKGLVTGRLSARHLSGPLAIGYLTYAAARRGLGTLLYIMGVLSVNFAVLNLLPIPVLDGGHLLFALLEKLQGRPVSERIRAAASYVGITLLGAVILLAFWNDIRSLFLG